MCKHGTDSPSLPSKAHHGKGAKLFECKFDGLWIVNKIERSLRRRTEVDNLGCAIFAENTNTKTVDGNPIRAVVYQEQRVAIRGAHQPADDYFTAIHPY